MWRGGAGCRHNGRPDSGCVGWRIRVGSLESVIVVAATLEFCSQQIHQTIRKGRCDQGDDVSWGLFPCSGLRPGRTVAGVKATLPI